MAYATLTLESDDTLALLTLNRPDKRNAISTMMTGEFAAALADIAAGPARIMILTGAGPAFCAGMDLEGLRELADRPPERNYEDSRRMASLFHRLYTFPKPTIAAVNGHALAGGCGLATLCDFTLAVPGAKFGYTEARIGFIPALVSVFLMRQIPEKRARDLLLTARLFTAEEAALMGLVNEVVAPERLLVRARELAHTLAANSPESLLATKRLLVAFDEAELERRLALSVDANARIRQTADFREGIGSFLEKRPPHWTGK